jgi:uncharacterized membrane protein YcaP (DUF421 family)
MEFFKSQESLTAVQWVLRAVVSFFFLLFATKIMGQRSLSQLRLLDFVMALMLGNIIAHPLSDEELGLKGSMITMGVLVILYTAGVFLSLKWTRMSHFLAPPPFPLIKNGDILYKNLAKARISLDFLLAGLRKEKVEDVQKVALALWEADGHISLFLKPQHQTVTQADMQLAPKPFIFPRTVVKEGKIDVNELVQTGKDDIWLKNVIQTAYSVSIEDVLLATIDHNDHVKIFLYKGNFHR